MMKENATRFVRAWALVMSRVFVLTRQMLAICVAGMTR